MASDIQVYGADWCGLTRGLREYLTNARYDYDYVDVDRDDEAKRFVLAANDGHLRFPIVVVQHDIVAKPTVAILKRMLEEHGLQPETRRVRQPTRSAAGTR